MKSMIAFSVMMVCFLIGIVMGIAYTGYYAHKEKGEKLDFWQIMEMTCKLIETFIRG